jgi:hypothetical protein
MFQTGRHFSARSKPLAPELIELQLFPQREPARAPLPRPVQLGRLVDAAVPGAFA